MNQPDRVRDTPASIIAILIGIVRPAAPGPAPVHQQNDVSGFGAQQRSNLITSEQGTPVDGTLMCAADGALYFIPDRDLSAYRLTEDDAGHVRALLDGRGDVGGFAIRQPSPTVSPLPASHGTQGHNFYDLLISSVHSVTFPTWDGSSKDSA